MAFADLDRKFMRPAGFNLYLPADASKARRIAQRKYEDAVNAMAGSMDAESWRVALDAQERARRNYGAVLLREDRQRRPQIYAK
ncbi:hypothetical protein V2V90_24065 (plasmid) [Agrobacterium leguminum]|uniref:hypothetical protein n=1 Tax=Agrobacterium leguminum TaxID=2792015 RepID=UPI0030CC2434